MIKIYYIQFILNNKRIINKKIIKIELNIYKHFLQKNKKL